MTRAVIFDLDGLLADTEPIALGVFQRLAGELGQTFTVEEYARHYSGKTGRDNVARFIRTYRLPWTMEEGIARVFGLEQELLDQGVALKKGARELLGYLREHGYQIALATSSFKKRAMGMLEQNGITHCFDVFVFGPDVEHGKPHPDLFLKAVEKLGEKPERCLILEDSENGVRAAHAAGVPVLCIPDIKPPEGDWKTMPTAILESLLDVIDYLDASKA